ncbi:MAG: TolC family protein [Terriglobia bacterium]
MTKKGAAVVAVFIAMVAGVNVEAAPPALTLQQAEQTALANHPQIFAAQNIALASNQLVREMRSGYYPTVTANITGVDADRDTRIGAGTLQASQLFTREAEGVTVDQLVTDFGRTKNLVASSRLNAQGPARIPRRHAKMCSSVSIRRTLRRCARRRSSRWRRKPSASGRWFSTRSRRWSRTS